MYHGFFCEAENEFRFVRLIGRRSGDFSDDLGQVDRPSRFKRCVHAAVIGQRATVIGVHTTVIGHSSTVSAQASVWGWGWSFIFGAASQMSNAMCLV